jgi:hypothetical protein
MFRLWILLDLRSASSGLAGCVADGFFGAHGRPLGPGAPHGILTDREGRGRARVAHPHDFGRGAPTDPLLDRFAGGPQPHRAVVVAGGALQVGQRAEGDGHRRQIVCLQRQPKRLAEVLAGLLKAAQEVLLLGGAGQAADEPETSPRARTTGMNSSK